MNIFNVLVMIAMIIFPVMITLRILRWQWRPNTRPCRWFGHDKKYVAIKTTDCVLLSDPRSNGKPFTCSHNHKIGETNIYVARWICRRCPMMIEDCLGSGKDWTIEHEKLIPDVKKWANWSQDPPIAREKLKAIQRRLQGDGIEGNDGPSGAGSEKLRDCKGCGAQHTGPCVPGAISP